MENISFLAQLIIAVSIIIVWVFRYDNIVTEFQQYGLSDMMRNIVGASKITLATILALGVWYEVPVVIASLGMAFLMVCAQAFHVKVKNPFIKFVPSALLLLLSLFIAAFNSGMI
jgi:preprotein translocase subunit SecY